MGVCKSYSLSVNYALTIVNVFAIAVKIDIYTFSNDWGHFSVHPVYKRLLKNN